MGIGPKAERVCEVIGWDGNGEGCEFKTWECQGGVMARIVKWMYGERLRVAFADWGRELKEYVEASPKEWGRATDQPHWGG